MLLRRASPSGLFRENRIPTDFSDGLLPGPGLRYGALADGIRQFGDDVGGDLHELWRRLAFSLLASNYDDHLRNHGFLMRTAGRWSLSPAYDLNSVPEIDRAQTPKTAISEKQEAPSLEAASPFRACGFPGVSVNRCSLRTPACVPSSGSPPLVQSSGAANSRDHPRR
jgi:hypothetical protein